MNRSPASFLEQMPGASIERIEIITNPSAKYRPDGTGGIINIVLKQNTRPGFNGSLTANVSTRSRYNGSLSMNYNSGKSNLFGTYGCRQNWFPRSGTDLRTSTDPATGVQTIFDLRSTALGRPRSHTANVGLEYAWNNKNKIACSGVYFTFFQDRNHQVATLLCSPTASSCCRPARPRLYIGQSIRSKKGVLFPLLGSMVPPITWCPSATSSIKG